MKILVMSAGSLTCDILNAIEEDALILCSEDCVVPINALAAVGKREIVQLPELNIQNIMLTAGYRAGVSGDTSVELITIDDSAMTNTSIPGVDVFISKLGAVTKKREKKEKPQQTTKPVEMQVSSEEPKKKRGRKPKTEATEEIVTKEEPVAIVNLAQAPDTEVEPIKEQEVTPVVEEIDEIVDEKSAEEISLPPLPGVEEVDNSGVPADKLALLEQVGIPAKFQKLVYEAVQGASDPEIGLNIRMMTILAGRADKAELNRLQDLVKPIFAQLS